MTASTAEVVFRRVHQLAGTAAMFGLTAVSEQACGALRDARAEGVLVLSEALCGDTRRLIGLLDQALEDHDEG